MPTKVNPTKPSPQKLGNSKTDTALDVSAVILTALRAAANLAPVPFLQQAAGVALEIFNTVQVCISLAWFSTPWWTCSLTI